MRSVGTPAAFLNGGPRSNRRPPDTPHILLHPPGPPAAGPPKHLIAPPLIQARPSCRRPGLRAALLRGGTGRTILRGKSARRTGTHTAPAPDPGTSIRITAGCLMPRWAMLPPCPRGMDRSLYRPRRGPRDFLPRSLPVLIKACKNGTGHLTPDNPTPPTAGRACPC